MPKTVSFSPYGGDTIKALAARQAALQQAAPQLPSVGNMRSPWQGASYLANTLVNTLQQNAAANQERTARQELTKLLAGHATGQPWTSQEEAGIYGYDPELGVHIMDTEAARALTAGKQENWVPMPTPEGETGQWFQNTVTGEPKKVGGSTDTSVWKPSDIAARADDYTKAAGTYTTAAPSWTSMQDAFKTAYGKQGPEVGSADLNMVVGLAKILDPNSVVREGESESVKKTGGAADYLVSYYNQLVGGGTLTDDIRKGIMSTGQSRMKAYYDQAKTQRDWISEVATRHNVDPNDIVPPLGEFTPFEMPKPEDPNKPADPSNPQPEPEPAITEFPAPTGTKDGETYNDPKDGSHWVAKGGKFVRVK